MVNKQYLCIKIKQINNNKLDPTRLFIHSISQQHITLIAMGGGNKKEHLSSIVKWHVAHKLNFWK